MLILPEHFTELFELAVWYLGSDGLQPLRHDALPHRLADHVVGDQAQDPVQTLLQLHHCVARLVPVPSNLTEQNLLEDVSSSTHSLISFISMLKGFYIFYINFLLELSFFIMRNTNSMAL